MQFTNPSEIEKELTKKILPYAKSKFKFKFFIKPRSNFLSNSLIFTINFL